MFAERKVERINRLFELAAQQGGSNLWRQLALLDGMLNTFPPPPKDKSRPRSRPARLDAEPAALAALQKADVAEVRTRVEKLTALLTWPGKPNLEPQPAAQPLSAEEQKRFEAGKELYTVTCGACHQPNGAGQEGLAPPLLESDWVLGPEQRLIRIALHGLRGPITVKGRAFELEMPSMSVLDDEQIAAVLTYIRRGWGHAAAPIAPSTIANVRAATEKRADAWTEPELLKIQ